MSVCKNSGGLRNFLLVQRMISTGCVAKTPRRALREIREVETAEPQEKTKVDPIKKWSYLFENKIGEETEVVYDCRFGQVRLDSNNLPGQSENETGSSRPKFVTSKNSDRTVTMNIFDEEYFSEAEKLQKTKITPKLVNEETKNKNYSYKFDNQSPLSSQLNSSDNKSSLAESIKHEEDYNYFDEIYFNSKESLSEPTNNFIDAKSENVKIQEYDKDISKPNLFDEQYFQQTSPVTPDESHKECLKKPNKFIDIKSEQVKIQECDRDIPKTNLFDEQYFERTSSLTPDESYKECLNEPTKFIGVKSEEVKIQECDKNIPKINLFEEQYFEHTSSLTPDESYKECLNQPANKFTDVKSEEVKIQEYHKDIPKPNLFEEQYFEQTSSVTPDESHKDHISENHTKVSVSHRTDTTLIDSSSLVQTVTESISQSYSKKRASVIDSKDTKESISQSEAYKEQQKSRSVNNFKESNTAKPKAYFSQDSTFPEAEESDSRNEPRTKVRQKNVVKLQKEFAFEESQKNPDDVTGDEYIENIRTANNENENTSMGRARIQKYGENVGGMTRAEILQLLSKSVVHFDDELVAFNKPSGLVYGGSDKQNILDLKEYLPDLAYKFNCSKGLHNVNVLDRDTSGVMLFTQCPKLAKKLKEDFRTGQLKTVFWSITRSIPKAHEGEISMPIFEGKIGKRARMALQPDTELAPIYSKKPARAVTYYKVLRSEKSAALIELHPKTQQRHQLRVHLGFGLGCPILGDHKYSDVKQIRPQRLSSDIMHRLGLPKSELRHLPLFLHCKLLVLPEARNYNNVVINAFPPSIFMKTLRWLKLRKTSKSEKADIDLL